MQADAAKSVRATGGGDDSVHRGGGERVGEKVAALEVDECCMQKKTQCGAIRLLPCVSHTMQSNVCRDRAVSTMGRR